MSYVKNRSYVTTNPRYTPHQPYPLLVDRIITLNTVDTAEIHLSHAGTTELLIYCFTYEL